jgi:hypothetical protein
VVISSVEEQSLFSLRKQEQVIFDTELPSQKNHFKGNLSKNKGS